VGLFGVTAIMGYSMKTKKSLGQHFLKDEHALERIIVAAQLQKGDVVLEIGPGRGALTKKILDIGASVVAIEKDNELILYLKEFFAEKIASGQLVLVCGDILETDLTQLGLVNGEFSVVANIPYYITGQIVRFLLAGRVNPKKAILLMQKEVAERIVAIDNKQSLLSISVAVFGVPKIAGIVRAGAFNPAPKVDSAIVVISNISRSFFDDIEQGAFFTFLKAHFMHKRKQLAHAGLITPVVFTACAVAPTARPEELNADNWRCLFEKTHKEM